MSDNRMRLGHSIQQRLEQRLTPQLIMNMKLLELPLLELEQLVRGELEQNPALEQVEGDGGEESLDTEPEFEGAGPEAEKTELGEEGDGGSAESEKSGTEEYSFDELLPPDGWDVPGGFTGPTEDDGGASEVVADPRETLRDTILPQLQAMLPPDEAAIAAEVIEWLDENGFLSVSIEELAKNLGVDEGRLRKIVYRLQRIPPGGIGTLNAREALLVQLEIKGVPPEALECRLLAEGWELLEKKDVAKLARMLDRSEEEIRAAIARLIALDPRPARRFAESAVPYVSPDFSVVWQGDRLVAALHDESIPRLRVSRYFIEVLRNPRAFTKEQVEFARKKVEAAKALLKAIESRRRMLHRLVDLILQTQRDFFVSGPEHLKPATLREVAEALGVHPATVSRAISGKYIETPNGIFPLKFFFQSGTEDVSRFAIKEKIRAMIEAEDRKAPLSDDEICVRLKAEGIVVSRRTVAKYRGELGIPGSRERRGF